MLVGTYMVDKQIERQYQAVDEPVESVSDCWSME